MGQVGYSSQATDCDDSDPNAWLIEDLYPDVDQDSFGDENGSTTPVCTDGFGASGYSVNKDDCDDNDPAAWVYEAMFPDADGDGFGDLTTAGAPTLVCTGGAGATGFALLATDCDDTDASIHPAAYDVPGDGIDQDCTGSDDNYYFDDFENGQDPVVWKSVTGDTSLSSGYKFAGSYSLNMGGGGATAETNVLDTSTCSVVSWAYMGKRGPETPDTGDNLKLSYFNGTSWTLTNTFAGQNSTDPNFSARVGKITNTNALNSDFKVKFVSNGSGASFDDFFIDNFTLTCGDLDADNNGKVDDVDGDGVADLFDCDPADPTASVIASGSTSTVIRTGMAPKRQRSFALTRQRHRRVANNGDDCNDNDSAATLLVTGWDDADNDGYGDMNGASTDYCGTSITGPYATNNTDCDDSDSSINPGASEIIGDGIDQDCDGTDLSNLADDFETGTYNPSIWANYTGDTSISGLYANNGNYSLNLGGGTATVTSISFDASSCSSVLWEYSVKKGPEAPDSTDYLTLYVLHAGGQSQLDRINGNGIVASTFEVRDGQFPAGIDTSAIKIRLTTNGSGSGFDDYFIDDLAVTCGSDADQDGVLTANDCDDNDPTVWDSVTAYPDNDGDSYGEIGSASSKLCIGATLPAGWSLNDTDCDDTDSTVYTEQILFKDKDGDSYGNGSLGSQPMCTAAGVPNGFSRNGDDCDDNDATIWFDDNAYVDADGDGYGDGSLGSFGLCTNGTLPAGYVRQHRLRRHGREHLDRFAWLRRCRWRRVRRRVGKH